MGVINQGKEAYEVQKLPGKNKEGKEREMER